MAKQGLGVRNQNGEKFLEFCIGNNLVIGGTIFKHKDIYKETWNSPDGKNSNQIDHAAINRRWRSSLVDVRAIRMGDIGSDHNIVLNKLRLKLKIKKKHQPPILFDSAKFKNPASKEAFSNSIELSNRFHLLNEIPIDDLDEYCSQVQDAFTNTSEQTLGYKKTAKKPWIRDETWKLIEERKRVKQGFLSSQGEQRVAAITAYSAKNKLVKRAARNDKKTYLEDKASEAQEAAFRGDTQTLYRITRDLPEQIPANPQQSEMNTESSLPVPN
ncbi:endonuclease-reverse transcriptase [Elysia marginata]|uniref:Endonuclease-reverse transcriptase n=1 Tax=Elysia marginata TaxID=1093978 RepID=A0AAV4EPG3_9GAST|nr:endonuclease-reverse transcriptase [Elysia marginata]